jgi:glutamine synthetase
MLPAIYSIALSLSITSLLVHGYSLLRTQLNSGYFNDLFDVSAVIEVPLEGHRTLPIVVYRNGNTNHALTCIDTETGPGVFETALAYTSARRMADNAVLFKFLAKSMGMKHGVTPSFMAKPWGNVRDDLL